MANNAAYYVHFHGFILLTNHFLDSFHRLIKIMNQAAAVQHTINIATLITYCQSERQMLKQQSLQMQSPHDAPHIRNIALEKARNRGMTFKDMVIKTAAIR